MLFTLEFTEIASQKLSLLASNPAYQKEYKASLKALAYLEQNPRHPALRTHKYEVLSRKYGCPVFEAYAQNNTPGAYRIFWHYGPQKDTIRILDIVEHP